MYGFMKKEITITREQFFEFVKGKEETEESSSPKYFLKYFDNYKKTGKKISFNFSGLFFSYLWFWYRKMYLYGFLFVFLVAEASFFLKTMGTTGCFIVFNLVLMPYENYIYLLHADKKVKSGVLRSGTNMWVVWGMCVIIILPFINGLVLSYSEKILAMFYLG